MLALASAIRASSHYATLRSSLRRQLHSSSNAAMNVHIVGAGSAGCLLAYHLQNALERQAKGGTVTLQLRRPPSDAGKEITISIDDSKEQRVGQRQFPWQCATPSSSPIDVLLVTTKADQTMQAVRPLLPLLARGPSPATIVLTQNGMGVDEALRSMLDSAGLPEHDAARPHVMLGINRQGTWSKQRFHTVHAGKGDIPLGFSPHTENAFGGEETAQKLVNDALAGHVNTEPSLATLSSTITLLCSPHMVDALGTRFERSARHFAILQQQKLVSNCVVNPLTSLYNIQNRECITRDDVHLLGRQIIDECARVFAARYAAAGAAVPQQLSADALHAYVWDIVRLLGGNWSSMVQDMWTKRGSTEIDFLNGTIVRWAGEVGVEVPVNAQMVHDIREKAAAAAAKDESHEKV